jgi:hypothetical protein
MIGLNGANNDKATNVRPHTKLPICQTRTEFIGIQPTNNINNNNNGPKKILANYESTAVAPTMVLNHPTPLLTPPQPRGSGGELRRVSIQQEAIRMDF